MPRENEKDKRNNSWVLTVLLPALLVLLTLLLWFLPRLQTPSYDDTQPIFTYDFRLGAYPSGTAGDAVIVEEDGHFNLGFEEPGQSFVSSPIEVWHTLTIDIHVSGLNLVGAVDVLDDEPIFTIDGYDANDALVRSSTVSTVDPGTPARVVMDGRGIHYFQLTFTHFAYDEMNPELPLGVLVSHIVGYDAQ